MSAHEKLFTRIEENTDISEVEKREIVFIYAMKISKLWDYYNRALREIARIYIEGIITKSEAAALSQRAYREIKSLIARLLIEQYYNTGDSDIFDRALSLDEEVELNTVSVLDMKEFADGEEEKPRENIAVFFNGLFINLKEFTDRNRHQPHFKLLIRDDEIVEKINKKINRSRYILAIDEATLGRKYYEDICNRSRYY
ncbi:MAG TPA: hypothetical protein PK544_00875 [Spirochaetota bacterium]|nr:hypothetical protein [Spirochaetota bacterium]HPQ54943.1 hypothetical protein [Spirochaetota bacterium]